MRVELATRPGQVKIKIFSKYTQTGNTEKCNLGQYPRSAGWTKYREKEDEFEKLKKEKSEIEETLKSKISKLEEELKSRQGKQKFNAWVFNPPYFSLYHVTLIFDYPNKAEKN